MDTRPCDQLDAVRMLDEVIDERLTLRPDAIIIVLGRRVVRSPHWPINVRTMHQSPDLCGIGADLVILYQIELLPKWLVSEVLLPIHLQGRDIVAIDQAPTAGWTRTSDFFDYINAAEHPL